MHVTVVTLEALLEASYNRELSTRVSPAFTQARIKLVNEGYIRKIEGTETVVCLNHNFHETAIYECTEKGEAWIERLKRVQPE